MAIQIDVGTIQQAARRLEVMGNNVANVNTVGYKEVSFQDVLGQTQGTNSTAVPGSRQAFNQGNITSTNNPLDVAINGSGLYVMQDSSGNTIYTRDGQFSLDKNGNVVNAHGDKLMGNPPSGSPGQTLSAKLVPLKIDTSDLAPKQTSTVTFKQLLLDSRKPVIDSAALPFNPKDPSTFTHSTTSSVYDAKGKSHDIQTFYVKSADNTWDVYASVDGNLSTPSSSTGTSSSSSAPGLVGQLTFDGSGKLDLTKTTALLPTTNASGTTGTVSPTAGFNVNIPGDGASSAQIVSINVDLNNAVQYSSNFSAAMDQDGSPVGQMTSYKVGADGNISVTYNDGRSANMGQVVLANFASLEGLAPSGNNQWKETLNSGSPVFNIPGSNKVGTLVASATEDSTVDLTVEMIKLISAQRAFQSAAEVVKRQDEILQTSVHIGG